jgi:hypothetical protein
MLLKVNTIGKREATSNSPCSPADDMLMVANVLDIQQLPLASSMQTPAARPAETRLPRRS